MILNLLKKIKDILRKAYYSFLRFIFYNFLKIDNKKIVFDNFLGKGYGCNPKYIAEELLKQNIDCNMVWLVNNLEEKLPSKIRKVKYGGPRSLYELATAKVWIDNVRNYKGISKKKKQFYIQTWHASLGLKKAEKDIEKNLSPRICRGC